MSTILETIMTNVSTYTSRINTTVARHDTSITQLYNTVDALSSEGLSGISTTVSNLNNSVTTLSNSVGSTSDTASNTGSLYARVAAINGLDSVQNTSIASLTDDVTSLKTAFTNLGDAAQLALDFSEVQTTVANHTTDIADIKSTIASLGTSSDSADTDSIYGRIIALENDTTDLSNRVNTLESNVSSIVGTEKTESTEATGIYAYVDDAIATLDYYTQKEVNDKIDSMRKAILGENVSEAYDTLVEIQEWIENHSDTATDVVSTVNTISNTIGTLGEDSSTTVYGLIKSLQNQISENESAKDEDLTELSNIWSAALADLNEKLGEDEGE